MEWQPIETAPKSESILVGRAPYYVDQAQWDDDTWMAIGGKCKTGNFLGYEPTHWMPLPESPKGE